MKSIDLATQTPDLQELLALASGDNVFLKTADGKEFVLAEVDDMDREIALIREQPELTKFLEGRSRPGRSLSLSEARKTLGLD